MRISLTISKVIHDSYLARKPDLPAKGRPGCNYFWGDKQTFLIYAGFIKNGLLLTYLYLIVFFVKIIIALNQ